MDSSIQKIFIMVVISILCPMPAIGQTEADKRSLLREARECVGTDPKKASSLAYKVLRMSDTSHPDSITVAASLLYGSAEQLLGNFDLSIHILNDTEMILPEGNSPERGTLYKLQGRVFSKLGDYSRSVELNDRATTIFRILGDSASVADCYNERGVMLLNRLEYQLADHFFRRALDINRKLHNLPGIAKDLNSMCLYEGNPLEKLQMIDEAITINKHLENIWGLGENYNNKAKQLYYAGRYSEAEEALVMAKEYIDRIEAKELLCDYYEYRSMIAAASGNYQSAYESQGKMIEMVTQLNRSNRLRNMELDLSRKQLEDGRADAVRQRHEHQVEVLRLNIFLLVAFIAIFVVVILFFMRRIKHRKDLQILETRHELELSEKEVDALKLKQRELELETAKTALDANRRELTGFAAFLKSNLEMTNKIQEMLREGYKMDSASIVAHLKKINAFISSNVSNNKTAKDLLISVEEKNKDFLERLTALHPGLTKGERNLAILIRGRLTSKEISILLGLEPRTVNMNRYRLRKALNLEADDSLEQYLRDI